ncbi:MAG: beta-propeller fold lactonase family protein [Terracidiphilus sp.]|jgi:hypothetical protein
MKFTKFGKALLMSALSTGVLLSVTSCVQSYTVGYLYVTGTATPESNGSGYITGFKIDHNTGKLHIINGLPIGSGGANPVRGLILEGSRFLYVLNRGVSQDGQPCSAADPCKNANITQFAVGANGILTAQETFFTQGVNPFRMIADPSGSFLFVLDHDSPDPSSTPSNPVAATYNANCGAALSGATSCGDITAFSINESTGRLSLIVDDQASTTLGSTVPYFPVPSYPVDFTFSSGILLTLSGTSTTASLSYPYTGGATVFPYTYGSSNGQLMRNQNTAEVLGIAEGTAIVNGGSFIFVLDNEPGNTSSPSQILPYTIGGGGALLAATSGPIPDDPNQSDPIYLVVESKGKWFYVANQGNNGSVGTGTAESGLAGYVVNNPFLPTEMGGTPIGFGTGAGPQCLVEDPSSQFFYTANANSSTVTGQVIDENAGTLTPLSQSTKVPSSYTLTGPPTWCLMDGRTH